MMFADGCTP
jgi:hypothetical protein